MKTQDLYISIVEDDKEIRETLALLLDQSPNFHFLGAYADAETALEAIPHEEPDVVLMDISLPGMNGIEAVKILKQKAPRIEVIMLTVHSDGQLVFDALCAGACGYLTKNTPPERILRSIREVCEGGAPMSTEIARMVVGSFQRSQPESLTGREQDVLQQLCKGKSYKMIADSLFISEDTVRSHIKRIYKKLEVNSKSEAVAKALRNHWV